MTRLSRKVEFIRALAAFLGGTNQVRMNLALTLAEPDLRAVAELWRDVRLAVPGLHGYPSVEETVAVLEEFIG